MRNETVATGAAAAGVWTCAGVALALGAAAAPVLLAAGAATTTAVLIRQEQLAARARRAEAWIKAAEAAWELVTGRPADPPPDGGSRVVHLADRRPGAHRRAGLTA